MTAESALPGRCDGQWSFLRPSAEQAGLAGVGVAPAGPIPDQLERRFSGWLAAGHHAAMGYLERHREQRRDPRHRGMLDGCTAVVVGALPYGEGAVRDGVWGSVAAHARGRDYHATVRARLGLLADEIAATFSGARCRVLVDTAPVAERSWAVLAGLGAIGRSGALLVPGTGPRVVLGEVLCSGTPMPAGAASEPADPCEGCRECVDACPTRAILPGRVVDCRRCLSYHTIENRRGPLPEEIAARVGSLFGCDECTRACPECRDGGGSSLELPPSPGLAQIDLPDLGALAPEQLAPLLTGTALERTGPEAILRNAGYLPVG